MPGRTRGSMLSDELGIRRFQARTDLIRSAAEFEYNGLGGTWHPPA
ncbi:MAG: hypothetical protein OSB55_15740 [Verrucomicrobiota bacterium]|nr:hypothetical protein [Verrucomicrobiota bacterium]